LIVFGQSAFQETPVAQACGPVWAGLSDFGQNPFSKMRDVEEGLVLKQSFPRDSNASGH
jgi:hypothetical protein